MQISSINNSISMNGNLYVKSFKTTLTLNKAIQDSLFFKDKTLNNDVVARVSVKFKDYKGKEQEPLFKINYSVLKENSKWDRFLDFLHIKPRNEYNKQSISVDEIIEMLKSQFVLCSVGKVINSRSALLRRHNKFVI